MPAYGADFALRVEAPNAKLKSQLETASLSRESAGDANKDAQDIIAAARADYAGLIAVLYENGFFSPAINIRLDGKEAAEVSLFEPPRRIKTVTIFVQTGPRFVFGRSEIAPLVPGSKPPEGFRAGQPASTAQLQQAVDGAILSWRNSGHAKARLDHQEITANHAQNTLNARIALAPGPRLRFGKLRASGSKSVRAARVRQIAGLPEGAIYSPDTLDRVSKRLRRAGAFRSVSLSEADQIGSANTLDINAKLVDDKPRRLGFGGEISSQRGLSVSGFWMHRNILGGAERFRIDGEITDIGAGGTNGMDYALDLKFTRPATLHPDIDLYATWALSHTEDPAYLNKKTEIETGLIARNPSKLDIALGVSYLRSQITDGFGTSDFSILSLPASATYDRRDDSLNAKSGYYLNATARPFYQTNSKPAGLRATADARAYFSPQSRKTVAQKLTFALRAQAGVVMGPSLRQTPADYLFFSGGSATVRGQPYQFLGFDIGQDKKIGGDRFLGLAAELRIEATQSISLVGFYDQGWISGDPGTGRSSLSHAGAGLGLRYNTALGPLRVDLGLPTSGPDSGKKFQLYIGIGQSF